MISVGRFLLPLVLRPHGLQRSSSTVGEHTAILNGFRRTFCSTQDLSLQKCVPCNRKDLSPMTEGSAIVLKPKIPEWELLNDGGVMKLRRKWKVKNFLLGLELFKIVADLAETEGLSLSLSHTHKEFIYLKLISNL